MISQFSSRDVRYVSMIHIVDDAYIHELYHSLLYLESVPQVLLRNCPSSYDCPRQLLLQLTKSERTRTTVLACVGSSHRLDVPENIGI